MHRLPTGGAFGQQLNARSRGDWRSNGYCEHPRVHTQASSAAVFNIHGSYRIRSIRLRAGQCEKKTGFVDIKLRGWMRFVRTRRLIVCRRH